MAAAMAAAAAANTVFAWTAAEAGVTVGVDGMVGMVGLDGDVDGEADGVADGVVDGVVDGEADAGVNGIPPHVPDPY